MVNINNKSWDKLRFTDIEKLLSSVDDENFFFEYKADDETPAKLAKEISAFSNTYGGYILLGVNDDKTIGGCTRWTEQRIHSTIHDSITPVPNFDVRKFKPNGKVIFIIKIEEGAMPPYITNTGHIYERVSSGSFPIKDSVKLSQLYYKKDTQLTKVKNKIELPDVDIGNTPNNLCGYLDMGFDVVCSELTELQKSFYKINLAPITEYIRTTKIDFSISRYGTSLLFSLGKLTATDNNGNFFMVSEGIHNFIEIMCDGSVRCRVILTNIPDENKVDITPIIYMHDIFSEIYSRIFGTRFSKIFIYASKYEKLTVLKQFIPFYNLGTDYSVEDKYYFAEYLSTHQRKYGNNLIIEGNRYPKNDYLIIDKRYFDAHKINYNSRNIFFELFQSEHMNLGYIDSLKQHKSKN